MQRAEQQAARPIYPESPRTPIPHQRKDEQRYACHVVEQALDRVDPEIIGAQNKRHHSGKKAGRTRVDARPE